MSILKKKLRVPSNVNLEILNSFVNIKGPLGKIQLNIPENFKLEPSNKDKDIYYLSFNSKLSSKRFLKEEKQKLGLLSTLLLQKMKGVALGYSKTLLFVGIGYYVELKDNKLLLSLGYSQKIVLYIPDYLKVFSPKRNILIVQGFDLQKVTQFTAQVRAYRVPNKYKHKGVLYKGETLILKEGKKNK